MDMAVNLERSGKVFLRNSRKSQSSIIPQPRNSLFTLCVNRGVRWSCGYKRIAFYDMPAS